MTHEGDMLVAAPERWDEACFAVPAIRALMGSGLAIGVLCRESQREFWRTIEGLQVISIAEKSKPKVIAEEIRNGWKASLVWEPGAAADATRLAEIPRRLGPIHRKLRKELTHPLGFSEGPLEHRVRFYLRAVEEMGIDTLNPSFFTATNIGIQPVAGAVLLSPDSDFGPSHDWPLDRWIDVGRNLLERKLRVTVAGIDGGRGRGKELAAKLGESVEWFHASPIAGTLPLLAVHPLVIAADSSLAHLAAHVGATCVTLFGPNDPVWKRPLGKRHAVVRRHVECSPCLMARCPLDSRCQNELETVRVLAAIRSAVE